MPSRPMYEPVPADCQMPYIGFHFVAFDQPKYLPQTLFRIVAAMPETPAQNRAMYATAQWHLPTRGEPPLPNTKLQYPDRTGLCAFQRRKMARDECDTMAQWLDSQDLTTITAWRQLRLTKQMTMHHAAWHVSYSVPIPDVEDCPQTELAGICLAEPITSHEPDVQRAWVESVLDAIAVSPLPWDYGYMEVADDSEICYGDVYSTHMGNPVRWRELLEYEVWQACGMLPEHYKQWQAKYPCKGVYWGNYFGPKVLARIGGPDRLKAHIDERCREDPRNGWYRDMPGGALFLALTDRISDVAYESGATPKEGRATWNGVWLWSVLREANVMI